MIDDDNVIDRVIQHKPLSPKKRSRYQNLWFMYDGSAENGVTIWPTEDVAHTYGEEWLMYLREVAADSPGSFTIFPSGRKVLLVNIAYFKPVPID